MYNQYISLQTLSKYDDLIDCDPNMSADMIENPIIREVCRAGLYLAEQLEAMGCTNEQVEQLTCYAGRLCFGRPDPWEVHRNVLDRVMSQQSTFPTIER